MHWAFRGLRSSVALVGLLCWWSCPAQDRMQDERPFPAQDCALSLPGPKFRWVDLPPTTGLVAHCEDGEGRRLTFLATPVPANYKMTAKYVPGFERGVFKTSALTKLGGFFTNFHGLSCYVLRARSTNDTTLVSMWVFQANSTFYQLIAAVPEAPGADASAADTMVGTFRFLNPPQVPSGIEPRLPETELAYRIGSVIGRLLACCIIGAGVVKLVRMVRGSRGRNVPPPLPR